MNPNVKKANKNRFVSAFVSLYQQYMEKREDTSKEMEIIIKELDYLSEESKRVMIKLFKVIDSNQKQLSDSEVKSMTKNKAQQLLLEAQKNKSKDKIMEKEQINQDAIYVNRDRENPEIVIATGEKLKNITGFLKKELDGKWNKELGRWELSISQTVDARKLYGLIANKVLNAEVMAQAKEAYKADPSEKNFLAYGVATALYSEKVNYPWALHSLEQAKNDPKQTGLVTSLEAMIEAVDRLKGFGLMKDEPRKITTKEKGEMEVPYVVFISRDAQKAVLSNLSNIDNDDIMKEVAEKLISKTTQKEDSKTTLPQKHSNRRS